MKNFPLNPIAVALLCLFPPSVQAALNLPPLEVDPALLQPGAPRNKPVQSGKEASPPLKDVPPQMKGFEDFEGLDVLVKNKDSAPVLIQAMRIQGHQDREVEAFGDVELRKPDQTATADHMIYDQPTDVLFAEGKVRIEQKGAIAEGPELRLKLEKKEGYMSTPVFQLTEQKPPGRGDAKEMLFEGENRYRLKKATYTTCPVNNDDWYLHADDLEIDRNAQIGTARRVHIEFKGVPILYTPWINFSLSKERKSGFLAPTWGTTVNSGMEFSLPYYWNIAPNRDATITPRIMAKRGVQLQNEFRYLEPSYSGEATLETLNDRMTNTERHFMTLSHRQNLGGGWNGALNLQKVSDDSYFKDLSSSLVTTTQSYLPREGVLSYGAKDWSFSSRVQRFQTIQDPTAPVSAPYERLPQLLLTGAKRDVQGMDLDLNGEFVRFQHPLWVSGDRTVINPSASLPLRTVYGYLTPKIGVHTTRYSLKENLAVSSPQVTVTQTDISRTVPIFSADGGLFFERDGTFLDNRFTQTLEPRLFYVYIPYKDQSNIPVFDSGEAGVSFAQLFSENRFVGNDRIGEANEVTTALTSRILDGGGTERIRAMVGQRFYFNDPSKPQVTLSSASALRTRKSSDILASLGGRLTRAWLLDSLWQFDPSEKKTASVALSTNYQPGPGKSFNFGYRYTQDTVNAVPTLKQVDASAQWPVYGRLYGLARANYSILDKKMLEGLLGFEYNAGCWVFRAVAQSFATSTSLASKSVFFQLELNGVGQVGTNPFDVLKRNVPGYIKTNEIPYETAPAEQRSY